MKRKGLKYLAGTILMTVYLLSICGQSASIMEHMFRYHPHHDTAVHGCTCSGVDLNGTVGATFRCDNLLLYAEAERPLYAPVPADNLHRYILCSAIALPDCMVRHDTDPQSLMLKGLRIPADIPLPAAPAILYSGLRAPPAEA